MGLVNAPLEFMNTGFALLTAPIAQMFPALPASTLTSLYIGLPHGHMHPPSFTPPATPAPVPLPSIGTVILGTSIKVLIGGLPAARAGDIGIATTCGGILPMFEIFLGSSNVFIGGMRAARMTDICKACQPAAAGFARTAAQTMAVAGQVAALTGVIADAADSAAEPDPAMASAMAMAAAMGAASMAVDAATMAISSAMGADLAVPPVAGALVIGNPTVLVGGFPMVNFPNPAIWALIKLKGMRDRAAAQNQGCGEEGEPVDVVTGVNFDENVDYELPGSIPFRWKRYYSSLSHAIDGPCGRGFRHEYQRELRAGIDGFRYTGASGRALTFPLFEAGEQTVFKDGCVLTRISESVYRVAEHGSPVFEFTFARGASVAYPTRLVGIHTSAELKYDAAGRLCEWILPSAASVQIMYDATGYISELRLLRGGERPLRVSSYGYAAGLLMAWSDGLGYSAKFEYDSAGRMIRKRDRRGYSYRYEYDAAGRCVRTYGDDGLYDVQLEYKPAERTTMVTHRDGGKWTYLYDPSGTITHIFDPVGGCLQRQRGSDGRVIEELDPAGNVTKLVHTATGAYVARLGPFANIAPPRTVTQHLPDPFEHRVPATALEWTHGRLPRWFQGSLVLNGPFLSDYAGAFQSPALPAKPAVVSGHQRDVMSRITLREYTDGTDERWAYDANGNVVAKQDRQGSMRRFEHFSWNLVKRVLDGSGNSVTYDYSARELVTQIADAGGNVWDYRYDQKDRLVAVACNRTVRDVYRYDTADNLIEKLDGTGRSLLTFNIGPGNRKTIRRLASGDQHAFQYDDRGRFTRVFSRNYRLEFFYDASGRRVCDKRNGLGVEHKFDNALLKRTTLLERYAVLYFRTARGIAVQDPAGAVHRIQFGPSGWVLRAHASGTVTLTRFDESGRCVETAIRSRDGSSRRISYRYSPGGHLTECFDTARGRVFYKYDAANRIKAEMLSDGTERQFGFDAAGNLIQGPGLDTVSVGPGNQVDSANQERFTYGDRGHLSFREGRGGKFVFEYDSRDQLVNCDTPTGRWTAEYDPLGRRVLKQLGSVTTTFYWDTDRLAAEVRADGRLRLYVYVDDCALVPFLFLDYESADAPPESGRRYFIFTNQIGTPIAVEDESGRKVWTATIDPYGRCTIHNQEVELNLRFPGHYYDVETGLHYNRFRYYDPVLGRYIQPDPVGTRGGINVYAYPSSPLSTVDLLGTHDPKSGQPDNQEDGNDANARPQAESEKPPSEQPAPPQPPPRIHSVYADGLAVPEGQQPGKITGPDPNAEGPHTVLQWDPNNPRVYKAREYDADGNPVRDIDFTSPTFPSGRPRPDHLPPPHQHVYTPVNPNNPKAGFKRGGAEPLPSDTGSGTGGPGDSSGGSGSGTSGTGSDSPTSGGSSTDTSSGAGQSSST
jgi:RHS repeat-associated protein